MGTSSTTKNSGISIRATSTASAGNHEQWYRFDDDEDGEEHAEAGHYLGQAPRATCSRPLTPERVSLAPGPARAEQRYEGRNETEECQDNPERRVGRSRRETEQGKLFTDQLRGVVADDEVDAPCTGTEQQAAPDGSVGPPPFGTGRWCASQLLHPLTAVG